MTNLGDRDGPQPRAPPAAEGCACPKAHYRNTVGWIEHLELGTNLYHNPLRDWLIAVAIAVAVAVFGRVIKALVQRRLEHSAAAQKSRTLRIFARTVRHTGWYFYLAVGVFSGAKYLTLPTTVSEWTRNLTVIAIIVQLGVWGHHGIHHTVEHVQAQQKEQGSGAVAMTLAVGFLSRLAVWVLVFLLVLANLGIKITALLAGLGIGGVAAALAVQSVFGDLIASLTLYFDRPFDIGDFIILDGQLGTVKRVGVRSTRVDSLWGEEIVFSNSDLVKSRIHNYARMKERRIHFQFGVVYETPIDKVERIPAMVREIIEANDKTRFARSHFKAYGDYALVFETAYYVLAPDYDTYMDVQHYINLELGRRFAREGIEFAYPTTTVHLRQELATAGEGS